MLDALGNEIIIGKHYGYCLNSNGIQTITIGKADALLEDAKKVRLRNIHDRGGAYGNIDGEFKKVEPQKARSVYACTLFPIVTATEWRNIQIDSILNDE